MAEKKLESPFATELERIASVRSQLEATYGTFTGVSPVDVEPIEGNSYPPRKFVGEEINQDERPTVTITDQSLRPGSMISFGDHSSGTNRRIVELRKNLILKKHPKKAA